MAEKTILPDKDELSKICTELWDLDENRCQPGEDYELDLPGKVNSANNLPKNPSTKPLFTTVDEQIFDDKPTYKAFRALLDNYVRRTEDLESMSDEEKKETQAFLADIMETKVMKKCYDTLLLHKVKEVPQDEEKFKKLLYKIWFELYKRIKDDKNINSCGFEHVFVGETRDKTPTEPGSKNIVLGLHNWIQLYLEQKAGRIDYYGYYASGKMAKEKDPWLIAVQFKWVKDYFKDISSCFVGPSPEFEIALYTIINFLGGNRETVPLKLKDHDINIIFHKHLKGQIIDGIGTAYAESM